MNSNPAARWTTVTLMALVGAVAGALPADAGEAPALALLERAREAAAAESFSGVMVVEWHDGRKTRRAEVPVQSRSGAFRFGDEVAGSGAQRLVKGPEGWLTLWRRDVIALGPSPAVKYDLSVVPGPVVAGRLTEMVEVRAAAEGAVVERLYVDRESGLLLQRELLDARGRPYRSLRFVSLTAAATLVVAPARSVAKEPVEAGRLDSPYRSPTKLGKGYRLVGAYEKANHVIHLFYSDGLHGLSVFEQRGHLSASAMPEGGRRVELDGRTVRSWSTPAGETVVWESDGVVYTVISDATPADVAAAVGDLPHSQRAKRLRRVAEVVVSIFRWR
ncbi:MAG: sigma-E factor regulatory protein RseB domain-containing protein [Acidimicrobiia bacterium]